MGGVTDQCSFRKIHFLACVPASLASLPWLFSAFQFDSRQNQVGEGSLHQAEESKPCSAEARTVVYDYAGE